MCTYYSVVFVLRKWPFFTQLSRIIFLSFFFTPSKVTLRSLFSFVFSILSIIFRRLQSQNSCDYSSFLRAQFFRSHENIFHVIHCQANMIKFGVNKKLFYLTTLRPLPPSAGMIIPCDSSRSIIRAERL